MSLSNQSKNCPKPSAVTKLWPIKVKSTKTANRSEMKLKWFSWAWITCLTWISFSMANFRKTCLVFLWKQPLMTWWTSCKRKLMKSISSWNYPPVSRKMWASWAIKNALSKWCFACWQTLSVKLCLEVQSRWVSRLKISLNLAPLLRQAWKRQENRLAVR